MSLRERLQQLASALPSRDATVTFTKAALIDLLDGELEGNQSLTAHLTVEEVAEFMRVAPSTVRDWLQAGSLEGYKLHGRAWRVEQRALKRFVDDQSKSPTDDLAVEGDISDWRTV